jgi:biopolymer transport protein TolQ
LTIQSGPWHAEAMLPQLAIGAGVRLDLVQLVLASGGVVLGVLVILIIFFVVTVFIIGYKLNQLRRASSESEAFLDMFWQQKRLDAVYNEAKRFPRSPVAAMFKAGYVELMRLQKQRGESTQTGEAHDLGEMENVERALRRSFIAEMTHLENLTPFLATVGSAGPFIGLFGTVWGIMDAFLNIGAKGSANLATVAPGIAEALIATAIGLVAAIPAVMSFNFFSRRIKVIANEMDTFSNDDLNIVRRSFVR